MLQCSFYGKILFFHHRPQCSSNVHLQILQIECFKTAHSKLRLNSVSWMHKSETSFTECFHVVFWGRYFFFLSRPLCARNVPLQFLQKNCFRTTQSKVRFNSVSWMHRRERSFTECFCVDLFEDIPFSTVGPKGLRVSTCSFYRKRVSELLNQK